MSAIDELVAEFAGLPGIGRKTAQRLTYFLLKQPRDVSARLARGSVHARVSSVESSAPESEGPALE